jgi:hypothetical protein
VEIIPLGTARPNAWVTWSTSPPRGTALDPDNARLGVYAHTPHARKVYDQAIIAHTKARTVVAATSNGQKQAIVSCKIDRGNDVCHIRAAHDQSGTLVNRGIVDFAGGLVSFIFWFN